MSVVLGGRECADAFRLIYVCCFGGEGMRRCIPFDFCSVFLCLLFWGEGNAQRHSVDLCLLFGGRECADAFHLISGLSFYVCCFRGKGMRRCIPLIYVCCLGGRECADAFHLISALSFYVCCFGGKGMRKCIPFIYVCCLGGRECADAFHLISALSFMSVVLGGRECADAFR